MFSPVILFINKHLQGVKESGSVQRFSGNINKVRRKIILRYTALLKVSIDRDIEVPFCDRFLGNCQITEAKQIPFSLV